MIGIWRQVMLGQFPGIHARAHLVLILRGGQADVGVHRVAFRLEQADGTVLMEHGGEIQLREPPAGLSEVEAPGIIVIDLPFQHPGEHAVVVQIDGREAARLPITAVRVPAQPPVGGQLH
ncbi:MAG: hypothetical protein U0974_07885 [Gemmatimonadales bacterium]|nr:hypothetical protein [Gemmatimonadales bacterium]MDZ4389634.1 hypothetical protein [Gemmatimonadales bacterium]